MASIHIGWSKDIGDTGKDRVIGLFGARRLTVNAVYWGLGLENEIDPGSSVEVIGEYDPLKSGFNYEKLGVEPRPVDYFK